MQTNKGVPNAAFMITAGHRTMSDQYRLIVDKMSDECVAHAYILGIQIGMEAADSVTHK